MISNLFLFLFLALYCCSEQFTSKNSTNEHPESTTIKNCRDGFSGLDCTIATCLGYSQCHNESICIIKQNKHMCVCRYYDEKGIFNEIENCVKKFSILHGVCFMNSSAYSFCECEKGWVGYVCEQKLFGYPILNKIDNILNIKLISSRKSIMVCQFYIDYVFHDERCMDWKYIHNGIKYLVFPLIYWTYVCNDEWCRNDESCDIPCCYRSTRCKNSGVCYTENNQRNCKCYNGWFGSTCEKRCDICCYHGTVYYDETNDRCYCECQHSYLPPDCLNSLNSKKFHSDEFMIQPCNDGYSGANCSVATCSGYKSCLNESICVIKDNTHICVCRFVEENGIYVELKNCIKKYLIQKGFCYSNTTGHKICNCEQGWSGQNCENKLLSKKIIQSGLYKFWKNAKINFGNFFRKNFAFQRQEANTTSWPCEFYNDLGVLEHHICTNLRYSIPNGNCYTVLPDKNTVCSCNPGWSGNGNCDIVSCYRFNKCQNGQKCFIVDNKQTCSSIESVYGENSVSECHNCCGHGIGVYDYSNSTCVCKCIPPYILPDCTYSPPTTPTPTATPLPKTLEPITTNTSFTTEDLRNEFSISKNTTKLVITIGLPIAVVILAVIISLVVYKKKYLLKRYRKIDYNIQNSQKRL